MDGADLDPRSHMRALRGLARLNAASSAAASLWKTVRRIVDPQIETTWRLVDVGSGGGDIAIALLKYARRDGIRLRVDGFDFSSTAVSYAQSQVPRGADVTFHIVDVLQDSWPDCEADVIVSSLFLHHFRLEDATEILRKMARYAGRGVAISDLRRSATGYRLAQVACRLFSRSSIVHTDGPQSVRNAFTVSEMQRLAACAGLAQAKVTPSWPQRLTLSWRRQP